ncbi:MAG: hypothetical protein COT84_00045 [Chlamydiae bacterium CG10_big_fil_rev_8_21_14_0_10_35_9]|nr:MAG: hypothetical protein COT84_00045 [Chlamydiae bacterium CG10_big_fil_rev_8_21_14_0_10_35_9]
MNILHLEASTGWGGQEIRILKEAIGMRQKGHTIVFVIAKGGILAKKARENNFQVYELFFAKKYWLFTLFALFNICTKENIQLVNTHSSLDAWIGGIAAKLLRLPVVRTRHLSAKVKKGLNSRIIYNYLADFVVTTCAKIVPILSEQSKKPLAYFKSIPTGIEPNRVSYQENDALSFRKKYHIAEDDILIGMVCFMRSWKGIEDFFGAAKILKNHKNLKWMIIGKGHSETYIKKAKEMQLEDQIIFTGHLDNPFTAIGALDIFTLLSTANEGVSQASLQAAFLKKPLITTPTGGLCEVCLNGKTGIVVPIHSPEKVAEAILRLTNESLRKECGENAHNLVKKQFYFEKTISDMEKVYAKLVS